jgi:glycosyltransferase involved in cell wall biosynthesis
MRIAFHSPLKSPDHPVPSGDRLMARLLIAALEQAGHTVELASQLRTFIREPSPDMLAIVRQQAETEVERISALWRQDGAPDLWFTYHPYYKAPDLLGPPLARLFGIPYVTAEASYSERRNAGAWAQSQALVLQAIEQAAVNICFTARDRHGLGEAAPTGRFAMLAPFLDATPFLAVGPQPQPHRLIAVAMMRAGDKMDSYRMLAEALALLPDLPWRLSIVGDGPARAQTEARFAGFGAERIDWHGQKNEVEIAALLSGSSLYVWPGCGEAYGLAYLEAQAAGVPVVAQAVAGVPEVVGDGMTGLLTPAGDIPAYAGAIRSLLIDTEARNRMAAAARRFVSDERSLGTAATRLNDILKLHVGNDDGK